MSDPALAQLAAQAAAGDQAALERLMLDHYAPLEQWIRRKWSEPLEMLGVEDIVQRTFAKVFLNISRYEERGGTSFFAWLTTIAENELRDAIRAQNRKKRGGQRMRLEAANDNDCTALFDAVVADHHTATKSLGRREAVQAVQVALAGLSEDYRRVVQLRYFERRSLEETAQEMGRSRGAVRGLLDRAKKKLRDALERASLYLSSK